MKINKIIKIIFFLCFISFLTFYIASQSGYYEYTERKKMTFTQEEIRKFEEDVKNGKNINLEEYLKNTNHNYQNKISKATLNISENISKYTKAGVGIIFNKIGSLIEDD